TGSASSASAGRMWRYAARQPWTRIVSIASASPDVAARTCIARRYAHAPMGTRFGHVLVVGAGQMGGGIAQVVAASGRRVSLHDPFPGALERGLGTMRASLERLAEKGGADPDATLARVTLVEDIVPADLMIEAISEDVDAKAEVFRQADRTLPRGAVLASNTSSIPITSLAAVTNRPESVIGMHFFNPVPVLKLVEVIRAVQTSDETAA